MDAPPRASERIVRDRDRRDDATTTTTRDRVVAIDFFFAFARALGRTCVRAGCVREVRVVRARRDCVRARRRRRRATTTTTAGGAARGVGDVDGVCVGWSMSWCIVLGEVLGESKRDACVRACVCVCVYISDDWCVF